jgi:tetratricopeptide (TPR) repeat protein
MFQTILNYRIRIQNYCIGMMIVVLSVLMLSLPVVAQIEQADPETPAEGSVVIRVLAVKDNTKEGSTIGTPDPGNRFVSVQVAIDNTNGTEPELVDALFFYLKDAQNTQYQAFGGKDIPSNYVDVGAKVEGWIWFELPASVELSDMSLRMLGVLRKTAWVPLSGETNSAAVGAMDADDVATVLQELNEQTVFAYVPSKSAESLRKDVERMGQSRESDKHTAIDLGETFEQAMEKLEQGDVDYAEDLMRQALREHLDASGKNHQVAAAIIAYVLGELSTQRLEYRRAIRYYTQSLEIAQKEFGRQDPSLALVLNKLGLAYHYAGEYANAVTMLERALDIEKAAAEPDQASMTETWLFFGVVHYFAGAYPEAVGSFEQALKVGTTAFGREHEMVIVILQDLGMAYEATGEKEKAISILEQALIDGKVVFGSEHENVARTLYILGKLYVDVGDYERAVTYHEQSLAIQRKIFGAQHENVAVSLNQLARAYYHLKDYTRAISCLEESEQIFVATLGEDDPNTKAVRDNLKNMRQLMGKNTI